MSDNRDFFADQNWFEFLTALERCPHALEGKTLKVASIGTNPYVYTDFDRNVIFNENGKPGVNFTSILRAPFLYKSFAQSFFVLKFKV
jgi:hypothetical protein